jgi:hypothetical protein
MRVRAREYAVGWKLSYLSHPSHPACNRRESDNVRHPKR